ncbi:MAG: hypothetical protein CSA10_00325 [Cardiobacteriales bacterium]|nr:MAG: hypothetical protein CSA10_00325 [Cardiobacteriales bacterium]
MYLSGSSTGPRIDLWKELHEKYAESSELFISMGELMKRMMERMDNQSLPTVNLQHDETEDQKWQFNKHQQKIALIGEQEFSTAEQYFAWLSTHHSDYFCTEKDNWVFKTNDGGIIEIVKRQTYREPELQAKLELLQGIPYSGDDKVIGDYLARMQAVYACLAEKKDEFSLQLPYSQ